METSRSIRVWGLIALVTLCLTACTAIPVDPGAISEDPANSPEPVMVIYHVKQGAEKELEALIKQMWSVYQAERMVLPEPHVCMLVKDGTNGMRFVEMFQWVGHFATEHPPASVAEILNQMQALCESRGSRLSIEFRSGEMIFP